MLELVRGYAAAVLDGAEKDGTLGGVVSGLEAVRTVLVASEPLRLALTDASIPSAARGALFSDLLEPKVRAEVVALATFAIVYERATELPKTYEQLLEIAETRARQQQGRTAVEPEPPIGRGGALERLRGFAERAFERVEDQQVIDTIEDELFRVARIAEQHRELRTALSAPQTPLEARLLLLGDLMSGKVRDDTLSLLGYVLRCGRARDLVGAIDYLVELAAGERGRRVADVRAAVELDSDERSRLSAALGRRTRRTVELRVVIDPSVIGGIGVSVGDTVVDGTVRHRLERLRETILQPS
ncbi:MAG: ATP synthase F1 subunit delta [Acidimicrobiales bacterium]